MVVKKRKVIVEAARANIKSGIPHWKHLFFFFGLYLIHQPLHIHDDDHWNPTFKVSLSLVETWFQLILFFQRWVCSSFFVPLKLPWKISSEFNEYLCSFTFSNSCRKFQTANGWKTPPLTKPNGGTQLFTSLLPWLVLVFSACLLPWPT